MQTSKNILLVRPSNFSFNSETAASNAFQIRIDESEEVIKQKKIQEFETFAATLKSIGVNVLVFDDTIYPEKPDAIFPNNWVTFHSDGSVILYPMSAPNRRLERRQDIIESLKRNFIITTILDLSKYENENKYLEGTGSIIFDHINKIAYACLSPRTNKELFVEVCDYLQYKHIYFYAHDKSGKEIYHTNVMMCIGEMFSVICLGAITDKGERELVFKSLIETGHEVIDITFEQMNNFAGNMLAIQTNNNKSILALSQSSFNSLTAIQKNQIEKYCELVPLSIKTIETIGGGSARCMIAEVFLQPKQK
ncbi:MAG: arginine deiminase-related protein [Ferruginibacter sp.]